MSAIRQWSESAKFTKNRHRHINTLNLPPKSSKCPCLRSFSRSTAWIDTDMECLTDSFGKLSGAAKRMTELYWKITADASKLLMERVRPKFPRCDKKTNSDSSQKNAQPNFLFKQKQKNNILSTKLLSSTHGSVNRGHLRRTFAKHITCHFEELTPCWPC